MIVYVRFWGVQRADCCLVMFFSCMLWCLTSSSERANFFWQLGQRQINGFSPENSEHNQTVYKLVLSYVRLVSNESELKLKKNENKKGITHLFYLYESACESWGGPNARTFSDTSGTERVLLLKEGKNKNMENLKEKKTVLITIRYVFACHVDHM